MGAIIGPQVNAEVRRARPPIHLNFDFVNIGVESFLENVEALVTAPDSRTGARPFPIRKTMHTLVTAYKQAT
jgi:hypothetical protein